MNEAGLRSSGAARAIVLAGVWLAAGPAWAVDGVIEINQARAVAGAVTATDTAGFPVTLDTAGSYRLTSNLLVPDANTTAIRISADNVTVDLNGFSILGPVVCSGATLSCSSTGSGDGIDAATDAAANASVENGTVRGMGNNGVSLSAGGRVDHVRAISNGGSGIRATSHCSIANSHARLNNTYGISTFEDCLILGNVADQNGATGINVQQGTVLRSNTANNNDSYGIFLSGACLVAGNSIASNSNDGLFASRGSTAVGNTITYNGGDGIESNGQAAITGNTISGNSGFGLRLSGGFGADGYGGNSITSNNGGNANPQVSGGTEIGTNVCGTNTTCP